MSITKRTAKNSTVSKVTFKLNKEQVNGANEVAVCGDFNNWIPGETPMTRAKNGSFSASVELEAGKNYQFRYLVDGQKWINDDEAEAVQSPYPDAQNSVLAL